MVNLNVFRGSDGILTVGTSEETEEGAMASERINAYELTHVGRVHNVDVQVDSDLQAYYEIGKRYPSDLRPGKIEISGKVKRAYINGALLKLLLGEGADLPTPGSSFTQPSFNMVLTLNNPAYPNTSNVIALYGVKFQGWNYSVVADDFVMENVTFKALSMSVEEIEE